MKVNECFSNDKVQDVCDRIFRQGKYYGSDYDSDESIHYEEGHGVDYHENDKTKVKTKVKNKIKKKTKKDKDKMIIDESLKQNELSSI